MKKHITILLTLATNLMLVAANLVAPAGNMTIDGHLDEDAWQKAPLIKNFSLIQNVLSTRTTPLYDTSFRLLADADNIYIGIRAEKDMKKLCATQHGACSTSLWQDDVIEIFFCPTGSPDQYYQFAIGAGKGHYQMYYGEHGVIRPDDYAPFYDYDISHGDTFYTIELKLPLTALYMTRSKFMKREWLFNVGRQNVNPHEWSTWSKVKNRFHDTDDFNRIGNFPLKPARRDILIRSVQAKLDTPRSGALIVNVEAAPEACGSYLLAVKSDGFNTIRPRKIQLKAGSNTFRLDQVTFTKSGKVSTKVALIDGNRQLAAGRHYQTAITFTPFQLNLTAPAYRNAFFPGQPSNRLRGSLSFSIPADQLRITIDGKPTILPVANSQALFDLPIQLAPGSQIPVLFEGLHQHNVVAKHQVTIRNLKPTGHRMVWIDRGRLIVDGTPIFALAWYGNNDYVTSYQIWARYPKMEMKQKLNFRKWVGVECERLIRGSEHREVCRDIRPSQAMYDAVRKQIEANRNEDFNLYYLADEPECRGLSPIYLKYLYDFIKELDPTHPVMIISREPSKYIDCADVLNPHSYISPLIEDGKRLLLAEVDSFRRMCDEISNTGRSNKITMITPQVHSYNFNNAKADYPTFEETNASIWSAIAHGAQGISPYIWHTQFARPRLNYGLDYIYSTLDRLSPLLTSLEAHLPVTVDNERIDIHAVQSAGRKLIAITNVSPERQTVHVSYDGISGNQVWQVFREQRTLTFAQGRLNLDLAPYQVILLSSVSLDQGLEPLSQTYAKINRAEYARTHRGNILFGRHRQIELSHSYCGYMYQNLMEQQDCMFDGVLDSAAWLPRSYKELWYEISFPAFVPRFSKINIFGNGLKGMKLLIWKFGEWREFPATVTESRHSRSYDFGKTLSTVKVRMEFVLPTPGRENGVELYEFEMIK